MHTNKSDSKHITEKVLSEGEYLKFVRIRELQEEISQLKQERPLNASLIKSKEEELVELAEAYKQETGDDALLNYELLFAGMGAKAGKDAEALPKTTAPVSRPEVPPGPSEKLLIGWQAIADFADWSIRKAKGLRKEMIAANVLFYDKTGRKRTARAFPSDLKVFVKEVNQQKPKG